MDQQKSKTNIWLIMAVSTATVLVFGAIAYFAGFFTPNQSAPAALMQSAPNAQDLKIKGNKNSKIYHLPRCPNYNDIAERNIIWFKTIEEAEKAGFRMAKNC